MPSGKSAVPGRPPAGPPPEWLVVRGDFGASDEAFPDAGETDVWSDEAVEIAMAPGGKADDVPGANVMSSLRPRAQAVAGRLHFCVGALLPGPHQSVRGTVAAAAPTRQYGPLPLDGMGIDMAADGSCEVLLPQLSAWSDVLAWLPRVVQEQVRSGGFMHDLRRFVRTQFGPRLLAAG